jgi:hypothetical protein
VRFLEVLICEFFAVDRLAAGALSNNMSATSATDGRRFDRERHGSPPPRGGQEQGGNRETNIATGEVAALQHELGDDAVELAALVAKALFAGAERAEVLGGLRDDIVVEDEVDAALLRCPMQQSAAYSPPKAGFHRVLTRRDNSTAAPSISACLVQGSVGVFDVEVGGQTHVGGGCVEGTMKWEERRKWWKRTRKRGGGSEECCKS